MILVPTIDLNEKLLGIIHPAKARNLLRKGFAKVYYSNPFILQLIVEIEKLPNLFGDQIPCVDKGVVSYGKTNSIKTGG